jgi:very-short-patch-repair endonuclease
VLLFTPGMNYNARIVTQYWKQMGLPAPVAEHQFHVARKWRFDFAFPEHRLAVEVQGGIWTRGRHTRGAALKLEWEKLNTAAALGWRIVYCEPREVLGLDLVVLLKMALKH